MVKNQNLRSDNITIRDLWSIYLSRWYWFAIFLFLCLSLASVYLLMTPPSYTRSASVLIKDDTKGKNLSGDIASTFSDLGFIQTNTNVNNEIISFRSPYIMFEVVKRLNLETDYKTDAVFYKKTLYGEDLPIKVAFLDLNNKETAKLTIKSKGENRVILCDFERNGSDVEEVPLEVEIGQTIQTPLGKIRIDSSSYKSVKAFDFPLYITRSNLYLTSDAFKLNLSVSLNNEKATVIDIIFKDVNIQRAEEVLSTIINVYNEVWIKDKNQIMASTNEFINERLKVIQSELGTVDNDITLFKSANMIPDLSTSAGMDMQQSAQEGKHIMELNNQLSIARYLKGYIRNAKNNLMPVNAGLEERNIQQLINEYNDSQLQRNRLVESSSEENLLVKDLDQQLLSLRTTILSSIDNYITALNLQLESSQAARSQANARISNNPRQAGQLLSIERQQKVKEALYLFLLQKREENELSQAFTAYNVRIITPPGYGGSMKASSPAHARILLAAFLLGLLIPMLVIYMKGSMSTEVRGRKDLENMETPFVGEIPEAYHQRKSVFLPFFKKHSSADAGKVLVKAKSRNLINEAFRVVRTNLEFMEGREGTPKVVMITSVNTNSGKTFISANLAAAMSIKGKKVLAIDMDLRRKSLSAYFGEQEFGLVDYLSGQKDSYDNLIINTGMADAQLDILPVGDIPSNPTELLSSPRLGQMFVDFRKKYDYIFLDCPPIEIVSDADIISRFADTTLFIIRAGLLDRSMLSEIDKYHAEGKYKNMCIILNGTDSGGRYGSKYGYRYGYKYGYHYGDYAYNDKD